MRTSVAAQSLPHCLSRARGHRLEGGSILTPTERKVMARYVTLIRFTDQGARAIRNSPARALAFKKAAEKTGISVEVQLWTVGACDGVLILSGDEQKVLRCLT